MKPPSNFSVIDDYITLGSVESLKKECISINRCPNGERNFWYSFDKEPTNIIEKYILETVKNFEYVGESTGAEWWTRVFYEPFEDHGFHVDLDVSLMDKEKICRTPEWSFVTYLSWDGGPTVITNSAKYENTDVFEYYPSTPTVVWLSNPKPGKVICWTKPYIHGVFGGPHIYGPRVTLMFNLWKEKPLDPECSIYTLPHQIENTSVEFSNLSMSTLPVIRGNQPTDLKIKGDRNMVTVNLCEGLPMGGTYMIIT